MAIRHGSFFHNATVMDHMNVYIYYMIYTYDIKHYYMYWHMCIRGEKTVDFISSNLCA